jgi:metal-dependent amidase/aminoacylase/carboxypeptidase family protein
MAAYAVVEYQAIVSRVIEPQPTAVLTVGSIQAGSDNNEIPSTALLKPALVRPEGARKDDCRDSQYKRQHCEGLRHAR